jgi:hypothetical protein
MSIPCSTPAPPPCAPAIADAGVLDNFNRRFNTATNQALIPSASHPTNGDLSLPDQCGTYTKCVLQASPGKVDLGAYAAFRNATLSGKFSDFEAVPLGGSRTLNGPMGSYAYQLVGADSSQFGAPEVPASPAVASKLYATELIELYWCALLRDVAFTDYATNPLAQDAAAELSGLAPYQGPKDNGKVTTALLFRGNFTGEKIGPYVSQFFLTPTVFGAQPFSQQYLTYKAGIDFMTDQNTWFQVQQGIPTGLADQPDPVPRYLHNGRGLAAYTHVDQLYQAYFTAFLVLTSLNAPLNPGNPYVTSLTQNGFGTFGAPDFASVIAQVAKTALNAVWYQKWVVHLRHRPESGAGLVHLINNGVHFDAIPDSSVFDSEALAAIHSKYGTYLLPQPFPEGSPAHPAYPTGHGTVGGACITILKFFFDGNFILNNPVMPSDDGAELVPWNGDPNLGDPGPLTVNGELHKLAHNVTFGHGLHGSIHWRTDSDASIALGEAVAIRFLQDLACTYAEPFTVTFPKLDGTPQTISNM